MIKLSKERRCFYDYRSIFQKQNRNSYIKDSSHSYRCVSICHKRSDITDSIIVERLLAYNHVFEHLDNSPRNSAYMAINEAMGVAKDTQMASVPLYLRNAPTKLMEELGYKDGYKYAHDYPGHFADLEFMPAGLAGKKFYEPADNRQEDTLRSRLENLWPKYYQKG